MPSHQAAQDDVLDFQDAVSELQASELELTLEIDRLEAVVIALRKREKGKR